MTTEYASFEELTAPAAATDSGMPEDDATLESGRKVRVRGLSRAEVLDSKDLKNRRAWEAYVLSKGMVTPAMNVGQARGWQATSVATEIEPVMDKIMELSGMDDGAERRAVKELVEDEGAEFRDVASGSNEDAARPATGDATG